MSEKARIALGVSNLNLSRRDIALGGISEHRETLHRISSIGSPSGGELLLPAGYQLTPPRRLGRQLLKATAGNDYLHVVDGQPLFTSGHQSWGGGVESIIRGVARQDLVDVGGGVVLTESGQSLLRLAQIEKNLAGKGNGNFSMVVFAEERNRSGALKNFSPYGFAQISTQVRPELFCRPPSEGRVSLQRLNTLHTQGVGGVIIDNDKLSQGHMLDGDFRLDPEALLDHIESKSIAVLGAHAAFGRTDAKHKEDYTRTMQERNAVMKGPEAIGRTAMGDILARTYLIFRTQNPDPEAVLPVYMEATYDGMMRDSSNPLDFVHRTQVAAQNITAFFDGVEARAAA